MLHGIDRLMCFGYNIQDRQLEHSLGGLQGQGCVERLSLLRGRFQIKKKKWTSIWRYRGWGDQGRDANFNFEPSFLIVGLELVSNYDVTANDTYMYICHCLQVQVWLSATWTVQCADPRDNPGKAYFCPRISATELGWSVLNCCSVCTTILVLLYL